MRKILIAGPDSTLQNTYNLAQKSRPDCKIEIASIPVRDYYHFDLSVLSKYPTDEWTIIVCVNEFYMNDVRRELYEKVKSIGYEFSSLLSPLASIDDSAVIGENVIIHSGSFIGANCNIGENCVINPNASILSDIYIGKYVTIESNVSIRENCEIGNFVTICQNSSLDRMTKIGDYCCLNISRQYSGLIPEGTFYSSIFPNEVRIF